MGKEELLEDPGKLSPPVLLPGVEHEVEDAVEDVEVGVLSVVVCKLLFLVVLVVVGMIMIV